MIVALETTQPAQGGVEGGGGGGGASGGDKGKLIDPSVAVSSP